MGLDPNNGKPAIIRVDGGILAPEGKENQFMAVMANGRRIDLSEPCKVLDGLLRPQTEGLTLATPQLSKKVRYDLGCYVPPEDGLGYRSGNSPAHYKI
jgi:hypothetical protein